MTDSSTSFWQLPVTLSLQLAITQLPSHKLAGLAVTNCRPPKFAVFTVLSHSQLSSCCHSVFVMHLSVTGNFLSCLEPVINLSWKCLPFYCNDLASVSLSPVNSTWMSLVCLIYSGNMQFCAFLEWQVLADQRVIRREVFKHLHFNKESISSLFLFIFTNCSKCFRGSREKWRLRISFVQHSKHVDLHLRIFIITLQSYEWL